jgi:hypothetical protein
MSRGTLESLKALGAKLDARWSREFAGMPRHTREIDVLDKMVEKAASIVRKAKPLKGTAADALKASGAERLALFQKERAAIAEARYDKPEIGEVFRIGRDVDADYARWRRHFAGQDRRTRDLALLEGLVARLKAAHARLVAIQAGQPEVVGAEFVRDLGTQVELLRDELSEISKARRALVGADRVIAAVSVAHGAVRRYRTHFAAQSRLAADSLLLESLIAVMEASLAEADAVAETVWSEHAQAADLARDLGTLREELGIWLNERPLIAAAQAAATPEARGAALATVANALFSRYQQDFAGQARATRDLALLTTLCDRLTDVDGQMRALSELTSDPVLRKNQAIVEERLRLWEAEWMEISRAKQPAASDVAPRINQA